ncbi:MAG TPA: DUF4440 domain-containing protein [Terriglobales bacterium]|nr:DUF4440 domain-containing protein [Terriglobales bacterium]
MVRRTQALFDAVAVGNQSPWKEYFADDAMYFDEKGRAMDKAALVADVTPLPKGFSGTITVLHPQSRFVGDTAVLSYDLDETETVYDQNLKARYHGTDTWMYRNGEWQIIAGQMFRYYEDPAVGPSESANFKDYVGTYQLAPGVMRTVTSDGNELLVKRGDRKAERLLPESGDIFFRPGVEGRILFHRDQSGRVIALIDRRNNEDIVWKKK